MGSMPGMASLDWDTIVILVALGAFPVSLALTRFFMYWNSANGIFGFDVNKLVRPKIRERCGAAVPVTRFVFAVIYCRLPGANGIPFTAYSLVVGFLAVV